MIDDDLRAFAETLADAAGAAIRPHYRTALAVERKGDASPVTIADRGAEEAMRALIGEHHPEHGILGEEHGEHNPGAPWRWVLDPIDGTKSFIMGIPMFATLISLEHEGVPVLGVIDQPILGHRVVGDGTRTTLNGEPVRHRPCASVEEATLLTPDHTFVHRYQDGEAFDALTRRVRCYRCIGDAYAYVMLATGWADVVVDPVLNPWDISALIPVVRGAGAIITSWDGGEAVGAASSVAASPEIHGQVVAALRGADG